MRAGTARSRTMTPSGSSSRPSVKSSSVSRSKRSTDASPVTTRCKHYQRRCNLVAPCCGRIVCCHRGHDESAKCRSKLDRSAVTALVCTSCEHRQQVSDSCSSCSRSFGEKGCTKCRMWYSGEGFHCEECGVCRQGRERDMMHCKTCKMCYPVRTGAYSHTCSSNALAGNCVGCGQDMFRSRKPSSTMSCGHAMHCECFLSRAKTNFSCPVRECRKTVANMKDWNRALDTLAEAELRNKPASTVKIYCFECRGTSTVRTAGNLKKCKTANCGSYNTVRIPPSQKSVPFALPPAKMACR